MRRFAPLLALLSVTACGDRYEPVQLYMAKTPECKDYVETSRFDLPGGITVTATSPSTLPGGGAEFGFVYLLPRGAMAQFATLTYPVTQPKGARIANAQVVTFYSRGTDTRPEIVDSIEGVPKLLAAVANSDHTQWRARLRVPAKLPERFDLTPPALYIDGDRYRLRTFTYRYFADRKAYGLCQ
ncbi:hypothetical protein ACFFTM_24880 [Pseudoduganella plicata]|uniref:Lipoprotein n=1 Tax=Pseudoduganella plicata TaxID=321984 RepID=A0A4P7BIX3_9BURK|nr:hypothetical protein [Pseudoduganella plicata]QBQ37469.1 hypothetical protein E1742_15820 [Pseudoduganella plicata]GGY90431.1 hypothetical protein GCM10007388_24620 [Pseudoduganella plicata]